MVKKGFKYVVLGGVMILGIGGAFWVGQSHAATNPFQSTVLDSEHKISDHGTTTTTDLTSNLSQEISDKISGKLSDQVSNDQGKVDSALQDYYNQMVDQAATDQAQQVGSTLDTVTQNSITNGKRALDTALSQILGQ